MLNSFTQLELAVRSLNSQLKFGISSIYFLNAYIARTITRNYNAV